MIGEAQLQSRINALLAAGWSLSANGTCLHREYKLRDFAATFAFMSRIAEKSEQLNHHPDWSNSYNLLRISLTTHSTGSLTSKDLELANFIETEFSLLKNTNST